MLRFLLATAATALIAVTAALAAPQRVAAPKLTVVAWADSAGKKAVPPQDAVRGGTLCKPVAFRELFSFVTFRGLKDKVPSTATWYFGDKKVYTFKFAWEDGPGGRTAFSLHPVKGTLEAGRYMIEVRFGGKLLDSGKVTLEFGNC
jgi:hypothetical protein